MIFQFKRYLHLVEVYQIIIPCNNNTYPHFLVYSKGNYFTVLEPHKLGTLPDNYWRLNPPPLPFLLTACVQRIVLQLISLSDNSYTSLTSRWSTIDSTGKFCLWLHKYSTASIFFLWWWHSPARSSRNLSAKGFARQRRRRNGTKMALTSRISGILHWILDYLLTWLYPARTDSSPDNINCFARLTSCQQRSQWGWKSYVRKVCILT